MVDTHVGADILMDLWKKVKDLVVGAKNLKRLLLL
jgi:hypothetical protein